MHYYLSYRTVSICCHLKKKIVLIQLASLCIYFIYIITSCPPLCHSISLIGILLPMMTLRCKKRLLTLDTRQGFETQMQENINVLFLKNKMLFSMHFLFFEFILISRLVLGKRALNAFPFLEIQRQSFKNSLYCFQCLQVYNCFHFLLSIILLICLRIILLLLWLYSYLYVVIPIFYSNKIIL